MGRWNESFRTVLATVVGFGSGRMKILVAGFSEAAGAAWQDLLTHFFSDCLTNRFDE